MEKNIELFTIGFTQKTAQDFFENLTKSKVNALLIQESIELVSSLDKLR